MRVNLMEENPIIRKSNNEELLLDPFWKGFSKAEFVSAKVPHNSLHNDSAGSLCVTG